MEHLRRLEPVARELLEGFRALVVNGPRQAGKSTLVRRIQVNRGPVMNLDDPAVLDVATHDPVGFLASLPTGVAIDEFQRGGPALLLALKMAVDTARVPGQFVLAGSTRFLTMRRLGETMTGRIGVVELLPLSAGKIRGVRGVVRRPSVRRRPTRPSARAIVTRRLFEHDHGWWFPGARARDRPRRDSGPAGASRT